VSQFWDRIRDYIQWLIDEQRDLDHGVALHLTNCAEVSQQGTGRFSQFQKIYSTYLANTNVPMYGIVSPNLYFHFNRQNNPEYFQVWTNILEQLQD
jgi:hypothetical protein